MKEDIRGVKFVRRKSESSPRDDPALESVRGVNRGPRRHANVAGTSCQLEFVFAEGHHQAHGGLH